MTTKVKATPVKATRPAAPETPTVEQAGRCAVPDCTSTPTRYGLCEPHYDTHRGYATRENHDG